MEHILSVSNAASAMPPETQSLVHLRFLCVQLHHFEVTNNSALRSMPIELLDAQNNASQRVLYTDEAGQVYYGRFATYLDDDIRVIVLPHSGSGPFDSHTPINPAKIDWNNRKAHALIFLRLVRRNQLLPQQAASWHSAIAACSDLLHSVGITTHLEDAALHRLCFAWDTPPLHRSSHPFFTRCFKTQWPDNKGTAPRWNAYSVLPAARADWFNYKRFTSQEHKDESQPLRIEARFTKDNIRHHLGFTNLGDLADQGQSSTRLQALLSQRFHKLSCFEEVDSEETLSFDRLHSSLLMLQAAQNRDFAKWLRDSLNQFGIWKSPKTFEPRKVALKINPIGTSNAALIELPSDTNIKPQKEQRRSG